MSSALHEVSCPMSSDATVSSSDAWTSWDTKGCRPYPTAVVLRLRVLQVVCGILTLVMGAVAAIEERDTFNLALAIPAGAVTVLAAGVSIHLSRGFGGYQSSPAVCRPPGAPWPSLVLWLLACTLHGVLLVYATMTFLAEDSTITGLLLAGALLGLGASTLAAVLAILLLHARHDSATTTCWEPRQ